MRRLPLAAVGLLLTTVCARAQSPPPALTTQQVIDKNLEALGGKAALESIKTVVRKGLAQGQVAVLCPRSPWDVLNKAPIEQYWKAPDRVLVIVDPGSENEMRCGFDGKVEWRTYKRKLWEEPWQDSEQASEGGWYLLPWRLKYDRVKSWGVHKVGGQRAFEIEVWHDGYDVIDYYDTRSLLLLRSRRFRRGFIQPGTYFSDYREVNGIKFAFASRDDRNGVKIRYTHIQTNVELGDSLFEEPPVKPK